ncbi:hypothetical protein Taro_004897 [Colocasia esculenta]|uniref:Uncharacterized protein n=1 Tax=Colocasia esculenta TaxID=4460 RepID=A0A843TJH4_COLES|nr:hypothetical protein [Colocasia esculenta]
MERYLLERYRRDHRRLLDFILSAGLASEVRPPPGAVSLLDIDLDVVSADYVLERVKSGGVLDLLEASRRFRDDSEFPVTEKAYVTRLEAVNRVVDYLGEGDFAKIIAVEEDEPHIEALRSINRRINETRAQLPWEKYDVKGWTEKGAHKYGKLNEQSWWEKWGEHYDGRGSVLKWTDKWAETELGAKWGDKWKERFFARIGSRQGETWHVSPVFPCSEELWVCWELLQLVLQQQQYLDTFAITK